MRYTFITICLAALTANTFAQKPKDLTDALNDQKNLTEFTTLLTKQYGDIYANLSFQDQVTILAPNNGAFAKIPYSSLAHAFENNQSDIVRSVLQYHILPGLHRADSYNGSFSFTPSWLSDSNYTNVTGGQVVGGVQQSGPVNIFTSGLGSRSTVVQAVRRSIVSYLRSELTLVIRILPSLVVLSMLSTHSLHRQQTSSILFLNSTLLLLEAQ